MRGLRLRLERLHQRLPVMPGPHLEPKAAGCGVSWGWCSDCGNRTRDYRSQRCRECRTEHVLYWTRGRIVAALRAWTDEHGRSPAQIDWRVSSPEHPCFSQVRDRFGSWNAGLAAAGLERRRWTRERAA